MVRRALSGFVASLSMVGVLGVLRPPAPRVEDRRVIVTLNQTAPPGPPGTPGAAGAPVLIVDASGNQGHLQIDFATQGKGTV
jgi:hypothetical protein